MITDISKANTPQDLKAVTEVPEGLTSTFRDYKEYKMNLDSEIKANAEGFVRIGYLLKVARDTNILEESGYKTVAEFAQAEYGLTKDIVSRFIAINDRYSIDGYSEKLLEKYEGYGVAKLQEMLTLSDEVIAEISPSLTKREIQEIKKEIAEEEKVTPIEVAIEAADPEAVKDDIEYSFTERVWKEFFHENRNLYSELGKSPAFTAAFTEVRTDDINRKAAEALLDILAPSGDTVLFSRIPGVGKIMISIHADEGELVFTNTRTNEKEKTSASDAEKDIHEVFQECTRIDWELLFHEKFEKPVEKPAPVPEKKPEPVPKKENAAKRQQDDGQKAAAASEATKKYQDEIRAYKEKTGWDPDDPHWTPEKGEEYAEKEKVAPVQQPEEIDMNAPDEEKAAETVKADANPGLKEYKTRELRSITDVKNGDRLVNLKTGEIVDVLGYLIGDIKCASDHGIILVGAPNSVGWVILEEDQEKEPEDTQEDTQEEPKRQQDPEEQEDEDGIRGLKQRIYDKEREFEEVFDDAATDGFTPDGLKSILRQIHQLQVMIDKMLDYKLSHHDEAAEPNKEEMKERKNDSI